MAEGLLEHMLSTKFPQQNDFCVSSAGTHALENKPAAQESISSLQEISIDISQHKSRPVSNEIIAKADLILVMENYHKQKIEFLFPFSCGKVFLLGKWRDCEIADPYMQSIENFAECRQLMQNCLHDWQQKIWK